MSNHNSTSDNWSLQYNHYDPDDEGRRESAMAIGNGYIVSRAAAAESADDGIHYPGTYRVGCYNRLVANIQEQEVEIEALVNQPNWLPLSFRLNQGRWFSLDEVEIIDYQQRLDMQHATLYRNVHFRDEKGRESKLRETRFISMADPHLMGLRLELTALNWSGQLEVRTGLDGSIVNNNVKRYAAFSKPHLTVVDRRRLNEESIMLKARTRQSGIEIACACRTRLKITEEQPHISRRLDITEEDKIHEYLQLPLQKSQTMVVEKIATLYTSRDLAVADCADAAHQALLRCTNFDAMLKKHRCYWKQLWRRCKIEVDPPEQLFYFRFHIYHILQNISPHTADLDVGVPPSGWQGEEYMGHIFWDEVFVFQFLTFRFPSVARSILLYRYRRLTEARQMAKEHGYKGAMFPWRSASTGREETPLLQLNLYSGHWMIDHTRYQHHIGAIIAYNICHYLQITGDKVFMENYGAELLLEIARFWASIASYNPSLNRYEIHGTVGPDEFHTRYPHLKIPGISNNSYTNVMAAWTLQQALRLFEQLPAERYQELCEVLSIEQQELTQWDNISRKMRIVFDDEQLMVQFEGFDQLNNFDIEAFKENEGNKRLDWWLEAHNKQVESYQVSKQADTSLLLYLLSPAQLLSLLDQLGYQLSEKQLEKTIHHHLAHTIHASSLSRIVYAGAFSLLDLETSWSFFKKAQTIDLIPEEHSDSAEGIHLGAMGGSLAVLQHCYLGIRAKGDVLHISPALPKALQRVTISLYFREVALECEATQSMVTLTSVHASAREIEVAYKGETRLLSPGSSISFSVALV